MARPGFGFHRFRLSRGLGFDRFGGGDCVDGGIVDHECGGADVGE